MIFGLIGVDLGLGCERIGEGRCVEFADVLILCSRVVNFNSKCLIFVSYSANFLFIALSKSSARLRQCSSHLVQKSLKYSSCKS